MIGPDAAAPGPTMVNPIKSSKGRARRKTGCHQSYKAHPGYHKRKKRLFPEDLFDFD